MRYKAVGNVRPRTYKSFLDFMFGIRSGFGESCETIRIAYATARRTRKNWILPGILGGFIAIVALLMLVRGIQMPYLIFRIILLDYLIFFFGWISGWNAASRWRNDRAFLEELIITNQRPAVVGNLLFAGYLAVWFRIFAALAIVEILWGTFTSIDTFALMSAGADGWIHFIFLGFIPMVVVSIILVWFHLETLRISYWMFAIPSLSQIDLRAKAIANLLVTGMYVFLLTAAGSMVTGLIGLVLSGILEAMSSGSYPTSMTSFTTGFYLAAIPGLMIVIYFKRYIVQLYELAFWRTYMLYCWYGAGETVHPMTYPVSLHQHIGPWVEFLKQEEAQIAAGESKIANPSAPGASLTP